MKKFDPSKVNVYSVIHDLANNVITIFLAALVGFVGTFLYLTFFYTEEYTSSMTMSVNLSGYTSESTSLSLARTVSIAEKIDDVFEDDAMKKAAEKQLGKSIDGTVSAFQFPDTNLIIVSVIDVSPQKAFDSLKAISSVHKTVTDNLYSNIIIEVVAEGQMPTEPSNSLSVVFVGSLIALGCAFVVTILIIMISYSRDTVKSIADVDGELSTRLFGIVHHVKMNKKLPDAKQRMVINNSLVGYRFGESFRKMAIKIESLKRTKGLKVFAITSSAENEGKTTISVNLAMSLASNKHKVLLIDCDFKKPSVKRFFPNIERTPETDFYKFIDNGGDLAPFIKHDPISGLYIADSIEGCTHSAEKLTSQRFHDTIMALKDQFDFVIIDTPPAGMVVDAEIVSSVADTTFIVVRQDFVRAADINDQIDNLSKKHLSGCILNDFHELKAFSNNDDYETGKYYQPVKS